MKAYRIFWFSNITGDFLVEANNENEAEEKFNNGDFDHLCDAHNNFVEPQFDHIQEEGPDDN